MPIFKCESCNFSTTYKHVYNNHMESTRHKRFSDINNVQEKRWICLYCDQKYTTHSGLWRHHKGCNTPIKEKADPMPIRKRPIDAVITLSVEAKKKDPSAHKTNAPVMSLRGP